MNELILTRELSHEGSDRRIYDLARGQAFGAENLAMTTANNSVDAASNAPTSGVKAQSMRKTGNPLGAYLHLYEAHAERPMVLHDGPSRSACVPVIIYLARGPEPEPANHLSAISVPSK